ncbi:MAG: carbon starvation protein A [Phycisphaeraceae bacterium]
MSTLLIAVAAGLAFIVAYHTYGKWLGQKVFRLAADRVTPAHRLRDDRDYVPTKRSIVFGHHFTSIAGTGPIVGPAIAVMWGWLPALLWVVFGSIFIGAVHDFGSLVVSLRNNGQTVGDIAGRVLNRRVRLLFLFVLFLALTIILAIFGLVIAAVFRLYPQTIFPVMVQIPLAVVIGLVLHRRGIDLKLPSIIALVLMYVTVIFGDVGVLHEINAWFASWPTIVWVAVLLGYSYVASVLPVWVLLQPRDYINALQLVSALGLILVGLVVAAFIGGAPPVADAPRQPLEIVAPMVDFDPAGAPFIFPFLFITIACGAISGFHCLVSSGTSSKQLDSERDARFVGYGSMLTEGFLATLVICACVAGIGLGTALKGADGGIALGEEAFGARYASWAAADSLGAKVAAFVDGSGNFLKAMGVPGSVAVALMGVLVASFAGTTLDTATRLQRYVVQELARTFQKPTALRRGLHCLQCGYDLTGNISGTCPECGWEIDPAAMEATEAEAAKPTAVRRGLPGENGVTHRLASLLVNKYGATVFAVVTALAIAVLPAPGSELTWKTAGSGGMILWPMFGATNQLMGGLAFLVIAFWLWRRGRAIWFVALPLVFMLIMPAWAMGMQIPEWLASDDPNWVLIAIATATLALEAWMIVEAVLLFPRVRGVLEEALPGQELPAEAVG